MKPMNMPTDIVQHTLTDQPGVIELILLDGARRIGRVHVPARSSISERTDAVHRFLEQQAAIGTAGRGYGK